MEDYSNLGTWKPVSLVAHKRKAKPGRLILVLVIVGCLTGWHVAGTADYPLAPAPVVKHASSETVTPGDIATMRANGRLLSLRSLQP